MTDSIDKVEFRKIQAIHGNSTFILVLPKDFVSILNIAKGDYVMCKIADNRLVVERVGLENEVQADQICGKQNGERST